MDVFSTDQPTVDAKYFLAKGIEILNNSMTDGKWSPGDLIGANGSDPETKAQSASYAPSSQWNQITEPRVATSTGHLKHFDRPPGVGVGWGDFDRFDQWQSAGRCIKPDMVEEGDWSTDRLDSIDYVIKGTNETVVTIGPGLESQDLPLRPHTPETLYQALNKRAARKQEKSKGIDLE